MNTLMIVVPCYNEEEVLQETAKRLKVKIDQLKAASLIANESKIVFVDDGSKDKTWTLIQSLNDQEPETFSGIKLSRNKGHQNALLAGLLEAEKHSDFTISMDADLQDDIEVVDEFIKKYREGNHVVYGVRSSRKKDTFFKRFTAEAFYKLMKVLGVDIVFNHADYRLLSKAVIGHLAEFKEVNLFLRGIIPLIGYPSSIVHYERNERFAGESKYPLKKMLAFAFEGITSFSIRPIRLIMSVSLTMFLVSIIMIVYTMVRYFTGNTVSGWAFLNISLWMIAGIQTLLLGVVGEYVGKIYSETKERPKFFIEKSLL